MSSLSCLLNEPFPSTVSPSTLWLTPWLVHLPAAQRRKQREVFEADGVGTVSYTHLTLPTIRA